MKIANAKRRKRGSGSGPSILDYFSKSKQKDAPKESSSRTSHRAHHCDGSISHDVEKSSAALNIIEGNKVSSRNILEQEHGTPGSSEPGSTTHDKSEPGTPPSPSRRSPAPNQINSGLRKGGDSALRRLLSSETPPSNDVRVPTPSSPPTPSTWGVHHVYQKENDKNYTRTNHAQCSNVNSVFENDEDTPSPRNLLKANVAPATLLAASAALEMGTPTTSRTPLRLFSSSHLSLSTKSCDKSSETRQVNILSNQKTSQLAKKQSKSNQLFLDFGQNSFGRQSICSICGMLRVHGLQEDDAQHARICRQYKEGVIFMGWKNERSVLNVGANERIVEVRPDDSPQHKKKVSEVKIIADKELGFANRGDEGPFGSAANVTSYVYILKKRAVGLLMAKRIRQAYELVPSAAIEGRGSNDNSFSISRSLKPSKALLGVHQIWVHGAHRHRGIASKLVTAARDHMIFGMIVPLELVAFSSPTEEGLKFAKGYIGSDSPLIYDIN